jgi:hypothetical protein
LSFFLKNKSVIRFKPKSDGISGYQGGVSSFSSNKNKRAIRTSEGKLHLRSILDPFFFFFFSFLSFIFFSYQVSGPRAALLAQVKASMRLEERTHQNEERASAHKGANTTTGGDGNHRGGVGPGSGSEVAGGHTLEDGSIAAVSAEGGGGNSSSSSAGVDNTNSSTVGGGKSNGKANHQSQSQQQPDMSRKARRVVRVAALQALAEAKPGKDEDDSADVTAIAEAESTIGDFKRKVKWANEQERERFN